MASKKTRGDVIDFFESLLARRFSDASRALKSIKEKRQGDTEFKEGYVNALEGLVLSFRTGDERDFLNRVHLDTDSMRMYRKKFRAFIRNGVRSPFDIGFFSAWSDLMQYRLNTERQD